MLALHTIQSFYRKHFKKSSRARQAASPMNASPHHLANNLAPFAEAVKAGFRYISLLKHQLKACEVLET